MFRCWRIVVEVYVRILIMYKYRVDRRCWSCLVCPGCLLIAWCYRRCLLYRWRTKPPSPISWSGSLGILTPTTSSTEGWPRTVRAAPRVRHSLLVTRLGVSTCLAHWLHFLLKYSIGDIKGKHLIGAATCGLTVPIDTGCGRVIIPSVPPYPARSPVTGIRPNVVSISAPFVILTWTTQIHNKYTRSS